MSSFIWAVIFYFIGKRLYHAWKKKRADTLETGDDSPPLEQMLRDISGNHRLVSFLIEHGRGALALRDFMVGAGLAVLALGICFFSVSSMIDQPGFTTVTALMLPLLGVGLTIAWLARNFFHQGWAYVRQDFKTGGRPAVPSEDSPAPEQKPTFFAPSRNEYPAKPPAPVKLHKKTDKQFQEL